MADNQHTHTQAICSAEGCIRISFTKKYCDMHTSRLNRTGSLYRHCLRCKTRLPEESGRGHLCNKCKENNTCKIEGCTNPRKGRGWCHMHWKRWRNHGDPLMKKSKGSHKKRPCSVPGCERKHHSNGYCTSHGYHYQKYGDPLHVGPGRGVGRNRTDNPGYACVHKRMQREVGHASNFKCQSCGNQAEEWAYLGGCPNEQVQIVNGAALRFSADQSRYQPMCKKCHRPIDESGSRELNELGEYIGNSPEYVPPKPTMTPHKRVVKSPR